MGNGIYLTIVLRESSTVQKAFRMQFILVLADNSILPVSHQLDISEPSLQMALVLKHQRYQRIGNASFWAPFQTIYVRVPITFIPSYSVHKSRFSCRICQNMI